MNSSIDIKSVCVCVCVLVPQCPVLCDLMDCHLPSCSVHSIFQARILRVGSNTHIRTHTQTYVYRKTS